MSEMTYHFQTLGRILAFMVARGLSRVDFEPSDAMDIMTQRKGDEEEVIQVFADVLNWMLEEGIIRAAKVTEYDGGYTFHRVQLTAKGLLMVRKPSDEAGGESVQQKIESQGGNADASFYSKIGELIGSIAGSFGKSIASG